MFYKQQSAQCTVVLCAQMFELVFTRGVFYRSFKEIYPAKEATSEGDFPLKSGQSSPHRLLTSSGT